MDALTSNQNMPWAWIKCVDAMAKDAQSTYKYDGNQNLPAEILHWLFLSDEDSALDREKLLALGITHVLSLNPNTPHYCNWTETRYRLVGIEQKRIHADDDERYDMIGLHWDECYSYLHQIQNTPNAKVLVHCVSGINRSGLIVCAAFMIFEQVDVVKAVDHCLRQRQALLWNKSFRKQLCILAAKHELLGNIPEGYDNEPIIDEPLPPPPIQGLDRLLR